MDDKLLQTTFDLDECVYLRQFSTLYLHVDKERNKMVVKQGVKLYYFLFLVCIVELFKNGWYMMTPMTDIRRFYFTDILSSTKGDQRLINILLFLVYVGFLFLLICLMKREQKKTFVYLFPFLLKLDLNKYVDRFYVKKEYALAIIRELKLRIRANLMSRVVYLFALYSFTATSIWFTFKKGVHTEMIILTVAPTAFTGVLGITLFYFLLSDIISTYSIYCGYLAARLDRLSDELRSECFIEKKTDRRLHDNHIRKFNLVLKDFAISHTHFKRAIMTFMPAFYGTFAIFPYCLLISDKWYTHGLLPHFILNTFFLLVPLFTSNEKFTNGVSRN